LSVACLVTVVKNYFWEKILYFYENPEERRRMGEAAQERVRSGFTWADYGQKMISHYRRILGSPGEG